MPRWSLRRLAALWTGAAALAGAGALLAAGADLAGVTLGAAVVVLGTGLVAAAVGARLLGHPNTSALEAMAAGVRRFERAGAPSRPPYLPGVAGEVVAVAEVLERLQQVHLERLERAAQGVDELESVLASMAEGVLVTGAEGTIERSNRAAERLLGVALRPGARLVEVVRDYEVHALMERAARSGAVERAELDGPDGPGTLGCAARPVVGASGTRVLLVVHDLAETRRVEHTRREFVANVSHELRTPLTTVKATAETLIESALADPQAAPVFLRRIANEVDRMTLLVADLLELSRLESGQITPHLVATPLIPLVEEAFDRLRERAVRQGVSLIDAVPAGTAVMCDAGLLHQVLTNLLDNAVKYSPEGGAVTVSSEPAAEGLRVSVRDAGQGIPPQHLPHVFERFYKVERARREGGTGLGLAIVKHIVHAHGGEVAAESTEGAGSTFHFTLPVPARSDGA